MVHPQIAFTCSQMWTISSAIFDCPLLHTTRRMPMTHACMEEMTMACRTLGCLVILTLGLFLAPLAANAQPPATIPRVGFIEATSPGPGRHILDAFRQGLRELGYIEGRTITIEARWAEERPERFPNLVAELIRLKVDVLVVATGAGARAAQQAT